MLPNFDDFAYFARMVFDRSGDFFLNSSLDIVAKICQSSATLRRGVVPEFLRTLVFARPRGDDQFADCTFSPSLDMSR